MSNSITPQDRAREILEKHIGGDKGCSRNDEYDWIIDVMLEFGKPVEKYCDAMGHYGGEPLPEGICPKCGKSWSQSPVEKEVENGEPKCLDCGKHYGEFGMDMVLPHSQWVLIHPEKDGLLCAQCIVNRASKLPSVILIHGIIEFSTPSDKTKP